MQSPAQTLSLGRGSCRDFAALFVETCRYLGLTVRQVAEALETAIAGRRAGEYRTGGNSYRILVRVITSYSIHYTKLYERVRASI